MSFLLGVEALYVVVAHAELQLADGRDGLHEADHGLVALGVELAVVPSFDRLEFVRSLCLGQGRNVLFNRVLEVGQESKPVFKLNFKRLVVNGRPGTHKVLLGAFDSVFAENGFDLELVHELYFPDILLGEGKLVVL